VFHKGQELYGLFEAQEAIRQRKRVIVCEGYMDVIQLAQAGFGESVAALGTAVTAQHVTTLLRLTDHVIFAFDGDAAGRKAARRALEAALPVITEAKRASFLLLPEGEDPDSLIKAHGAGAFEDELSRALPLSRWFARTLAEGRNLDEAEDRAALLAEAQPLLESMQPGALRLQLVRELAGAARTAMDDIESLFGLKKWRRLPERSADAGRRAGRTRSAGDLKARILRHLISFPDLAREFNAQIAAESLESIEPIDRQIAEVWRAATGGAGTSSGALLELLADSEFAQTYRGLAALDLSVSEDAAAARADLAAGFATLELRRVELELTALVQGTLNDETKLRIRELSERRISLKAMPRGSGAVDG
jgi:DNA primase